MRLNDALNQIAEIREQVARGQVFRGYRAATTAFTGLMAIAAALVQRYWMHETTAEHREALWVWLAAAAVSLIVVGSEMVVRYRRSDAPLQRETTRLAVEQFAPSLMAGGMLAYAVHNWAGPALSLLPAIWCSTFGLGVFASRRVLPRGTFAVGAWYLLASMACVATRQDVSFSTQMGCAFGGGQLLAAGVLYWTLERSNARP